MYFPNLQIDFIICLITEWNLNLTMPSRLGDAYEKTAPENINALLKTIDQAAVRSILPCPSVR